MTNTLFEGSMKVANTLRKVEQQLLSEGLKASLQTDDGAPSVDYMQNDLFVRIRTNGDKLWVYLTNDDNYSEDVDLNATDENIKLIGTAIRHLEHTLDCINL